MFCPNCGMQLNEKDNICSKCNLPITQIDLNNNMKTKRINSKLKMTIAGILLVVIVLSFFVFMVLNKDKNNSTIPNLPSKIVLNEYGIPKFITGAFADSKIKSKEDAIKALTEIKDLMKINDVNKEFNIIDEISNDGITYYKFQQMYKNIPVYAQQLIISIDKKGSIKSLSGEYIPNISLNTTAKISSKDAEIIAEKLFDTEAHIINNDLYIIADNADNDLVYIIDIATDSVVERIIIDANSSEIIEKTDLFNYVSYNYNGEGLLNQNHNVFIEEYQELMPLKKRYRFVDLDRNIIIVDGNGIGMDTGGSIISSLFSSSSPITGDINDNSRFKYLFDNFKNQQTVKTAVTTMKAFEDIHDYYKNILGRNSSDNKGAKTIVNIDISENTFGNERVANAAWNKATKQFYIGEYKNLSFGASKDILAHEYTHSVVGNIVDFISSPKQGDKNKPFETGALNEGYADVLGFLVSGEEFIIGKDTVFEEYIKRDLTNPHRFDSPAKKGGEYWYPDSALQDKTLEEFLATNKFKTINDYDNGGEHHNSTVVGHAAYLMYKSGAFKDKEEMAKVWYNSLFLLSSTADFESAALAVIKTAEHLGLSNDNIDKIINAFEDTNMLKKTHAKLDGFVYNNKGALKGANIKISHVNNPIISYNAGTNKDGKYEIDNIPVGQYEIIFSKKGYDDFKTVIVIEDDTKLDINLENLTIDDNSGDLFHCNDIIQIKKVSNIVNWQKKIDIKTYKSYQVDTSKYYFVHYNFDLILNDTPLLTCIIEKNSKIPEPNISDIGTDIIWDYDFNKPVTSNTELVARAQKGLSGENYSLNGPFLFGVQMRTGAKGESNSCVVAALFENTSNYKPCITGVVLRGSVSIGDEIELVSKKNINMKASVKHIVKLGNNGVYDIPVESAKYGDYVHIILDIPYDQVKGLTVVSLAKPNTITSHSKMKMKVLFEKKNTEEYVPLNPGEYNITLRSNYLVCTGVNWGECWQNGKFNITKEINPQNIFEITVNLEDFNDPVFVTMDAGVFIDVEMSFKFTRSDGKNGIVNYAGKAIIVEFLD